LLLAFMRRMIATGMTVRSGSRRYRQLAYLALALFSVFLLTSELEHHDIACHLKTPQHCTACAQSQLGSDPHTPASFAQTVLADAGYTLPDAVLLSGTVLPTRSSGRSPPAA
jgi:hypothetical protein